MSIRPVVRAVLGTVTALAAAGVAVQAQGGAPIGPLLRPLGATVASSSIPFQNVMQVVGLRDGRVLVNDGMARLVWMLDASLRNPRVIVDSVAGAANSYIQEVGTLIAAVGDTSLFFERRSGTFLFIAPDGRIAGVMAPPSPGGASQPAGTATKAVVEQTGSLPSRPVFGIHAGVPAMAASLGLVYGTDTKLAFSTRGRDPGEYTVEDSTAILVLHGSTRTVDTLVKLGMGTRTTYTVPAPGSRFVLPKTAPTIFAAADQWAVTSDGSVAIVRVRDYHISWINPDGTHTESPRIPYPWRPLTDADKTRLVDSVNAVEQKHHDDLDARRVADSIAGRGRIVAGKFNNGILNLTPPAYDLTSAPDFIPPTVNDFRVVRADADNNVWIQVRLPGASAAAQTFDVVNRTGALIDRVKLPEGRQLIGFAPGGTVLMIAHDGGKMMIEKASVR